MMRSSRDVVAGLVFVAIGAVAAWEVRHIAVGTLNAMGPGYFPLALSVGLMVLGACNVAKGLLRPGEAVPRHWPIVPLLFLVGGIALFGWLVERSGLLAAVFVLAVAIGYAELRRHPVQVVGSAVVLSVAATLIFVEFLGMPIKAY